MPHPHTYPLRRKALALSIQLLLAGSALAALSIPGPAVAAGNEARPTIRLEGGPLGDVLARYAAQAGVRLSFEPTLVAGLHSKGLNGSYSLHEGFRQLLANTPLEAVLLGNGGYTLKKLPLVGPAGSEETALKPLVVSAAGERASASGPLRGYVARRSATATKTDTPLLETPQSITVIGQEEMHTMGATSLDAALRYVPGVIAEIHGHDDRLVDWLALRGFTVYGGATFQDGLKMSAMNDLIVQNETYGSERVEVLRGPNASTYGAGDVGGIVNRVSKRPRPGQVNEIGASIGNYATRQLRADLGGTLGSGDHAWRLVGLAHGNQPQMDYPGVSEAPIRRLYLAPSLALKLSENTDLTLLASIADMRYSYSAGELLTADFRNSGIPYGLPHYDSGKARRQAIGYEFEHRFSESLRFRQHLRHATGRNDLDYAYASSYHLPSDPSQAVSGTLYATEGSTRDLGVDSHLIGNFRTGAIAHTLLAGIDYQRGSNRSTLYSDAAPDFFPSRPDYTLQPARANTLRMRNSGDIEQLAAYVQDQMALGGWRLTAGLRHDHARSVAHNHLAGSREPRNDSALTGRLGVNYLFANGIAPYASYGTSFLPQGGRDRQGNNFAPLQGEQVELGVKYQPHAKALFTAALFDLNKRNVLTADPANPAFQVMRGEIRSRGLELEGRGQLLPGLNLVAQYTLTDIVLVKNNDGNEGKHLNGVPRHMASAWLDYTVQGGALRGLGGGLGARYRGPSERNDANTQGKSPGYALYDAALWYKSGAWTTRLNASNLTDANESPQTSWSFARVPRRNIMLSVDYRF